MGKESKRDYKGLFRRMAFPVFMTIIVAVGVLVVIFYKGGEAQKDAVEYYIYDGEAKEYVLENDELLFVLNPETTAFQLTDKSNGKVWHSNPLNLGESDAKLEKLGATLELSVSNQKGQDSYYNNYQNGGIKEKYYKIQQENDSITVRYSIGKIPKNYLLPMAITAEDFNNRINNAASPELRKQLNKVKNFYRFASIKKLKEDKEADMKIIEQYPSVKEQDLYIIAGNMKDSLLRQIEAIWKEVGYTEEDLARDNELLAELQEETENLFYNISMVYKLNGDSLDVEVPLSEITYPKKVPITNLVILPYFASSLAEEKGSMLVPEGGGALIPFSNPTGSTTVNYRTPIYGADYGRRQTQNRTDHRSNFGVYGCLKEDASMMCVLDEGKSYVSVVATPANSVIPYSSVYAEYDICRKENVKSIPGRNAHAYTFGELFRNESIKQKYIFTDSGSYVDLATRYREYLLENKGLPNGSGSTSTPFCLEIVGAVDNVEPLLGIPVNRQHALTDYNQAKQIMEDMSGVENLSVLYKGWADGGMRQKIFNTVRHENALGSMSELKDLNACAQEYGVDLYLNAITDYAYDSGRLEGFSRNEDASQYLDNRYVKLSEISKVTYMNRPESTYWLLTWGSRLNIINNILEFSNKNKFNLSFDDIGSGLSGDYSENETYSREYVRKEQTSILSRIKEESGQKIVISQGNDFALPYVDLVTGMTLKGSEYYMIEKNIPFYQLAIHGYIEYIGENINLANDPEEALLQSAEYGAGLGFCTMFGSISDIENTAYSMYCNTNYEIIKNDIVSIYQRYNKELGHTFRQKMVGHECLDGNVTCTTYEDGTKVYVNYGYSEQAVDQITIPGRDYTVTSSEVQK